MKRILRTLTLAALTACLLAVSALADSGPKPLLTVTVEHPPEGGLLPGPAGGGPSV